MRNASSRKASMLCAASVASLALGIGSAAAQQAAPADGAGAVGEIVVTASRIARTGFTAPTPTTVVNAGDFERRAANNVSEVLLEIPAFRPSTSPTVRPTAGTGTAQTFSDLRGLGSQRTLLLVNGRRHVPTAVTGQVDLQMIPTIVIDRTEVVTGGASAAWGSDAVAGVVNLILKNRLQGVEANAQYGISELGDALNWKAAVAAGTSFQGGRGHIMFGGEFSEDQGTGYQNVDKRQKWAKQRGILSNSNFRTNGLPATIYAENIQYATMTAGSIITGVPNVPGASSLLGITFGPGGTLGRLQMGQVFGTQMTGGGQPGENPGNFALFKSPVRRWNAMAHLGYDINERLHASLEASYARVNVNSKTIFMRDFGLTGVPPASPPTPRGALIARVENPYMPAALRQQMTSLGVSAVYLGRDDQSLGTQGVHIQNVTKRLVAALEGDLGGKGGWKWDAYYQYGRNDTHEETKDNRRIDDHWTRATDVVTNPATGRPICRSTLTVPNDGCVPYNVFGPAESSLEARLYVTEDGWVRSKITQQVAAFNLRGDLFDLIAGPVSLAAGGEWRQDKVDQTRDPITLAGRYQFGNAQGLQGTVNVKEAYAELLVPLVRDVRFANKVDLSLAGRHTDYSTSGSVNTWKLGVSWDVSQEVRFRGALSRDIRAANIFELYGSSGTGPVQNLVDRVLNTPTRNVVQITSGNANLTPERATTYTLGAIYQPSWLRGLRLAVDYYNIDLRDQITQTGAQNIVDRCGQGLAEYCPLIIRGAGNVIDEVRNPFLNLNQFKTAGWDIEVVYARQLSALFGPSAPGDFVLRVFGTHVDNLTNIDLLGPIEYAGQLGDVGVPHWTGTGTLTYNIGRVSATVQGRFVQGGNIDNLAAPGTNRSANKYTVPSVAFWNLSASYDVIPRSSNRQLQVYGLIENVLDEHPPFPFLNHPYYDIIGRAFRVGVRLKR